MLRAEIHSNIHVYDHWHRLVGPRAGRLLHISHLDFQRLRGDPAVVLDGRPLEGERVQGLRVRPGGIDDDRRLDRAAVVQGDAGHLAAGSVAVDPLDVRSPSEFAAAPHRCVGNVASGQLGIVHITSLCAEEHASDVAAIVLPEGLVVDPSRREVRPRRDVGQPPPHLVHIPIHNRYLARVHGLTDPRDVRLACWARKRLHCATPHLVQHAEVLICCSLQMIRPTFPAMVSLPSQAAGILQGVEGPHDRGRAGRRSVAWGGVAVHVQRGVPLLPQFQRTSAANDAATDNDDVVCATTAVQPADGARARDRKRGREQCTGGTGPRANLQSSLQRLHGCGYKLLPFGREASATRAKGRGGLCCATLFCA
mmetsp:Transcript_4742/g.17920  ORF Transcript_4742/g.17920 Transcript_4742/m.17920 type:complete len:367 (+) Transcript_4742:546-1646(+)